MHQRTNYALLALLVVLSGILSYTFSFTTTKLSLIVPSSSHFTAQAASSLTQGLAVYYPFDESSGMNAVDGAGSNAATFVGALPWGVGKVGSGSVNLDGSTNYGVTTNAVSASSAGYSFAFWLKAPQGAALDSYAIFSWAATTCRFGGRVTNAINCYVDDTSGGSAYYGTALNDGAWHHIVFTSTDGGSAANDQVLYVDGVQRGTATESNGGYSSKVWIGSYINGGGKFKGSLDDFRVYNRVLSSAEVGDLYNITTTSSGGTSNPTPTQSTPTTPTNPDPAPAASPSTPPATPSNQAPTVSAGTNKTITLPNTLSLSGTATDDGLPSGSSLITTWSVISGGAVTFASANSLITEATFASAGAYTLRLTASDGTLSATSDVTVTVNPAASSSSGPKTWNVARGSGDFPTSTYPIQACANVAKAGDTCLVQAGEYDDYVTTKAGGTAGNYLTFQASGRAVMNGFWIKHPYVKVTGFEITQANIQKVIAQSPYASRSVHIDAGADYCVFANNSIKNGPFVNLKKAYFNANDKTISFLDDLNDKYVNGGFLRAGIKPGDPLTILAFEAKPILNQSQKRVNVSRTEGSVTDRVLRLSATSPITQEGPVNVFITAFNSSDVPFNAIYMEGNNCQINNNTFENLNAFGIIFSGSQNVISRNTFSLMAGGDVFQIWGHDHLLQYNYITNSTPEIVPGAHQDFFQTYATGGPNAYNITFDHNFVENFDGALAQMNAVRTVGGAPTLIAGFHDIYFTNNVFVNVTGKASVDIPNTKFIGNTFYNVGSETSAAIIFSSYIGPGDNGGLADGGVVKNNVFLGIGNSRNGGWYGTDANTHLAQTDYNYVAGTPGLGYQSKTGFNETNGVNGGDPGFLNVANPVGADGVPFTNDDGLIPLLGSSLCEAGEGGVHIGAYSCLVPNGPYLFPRFTSLPTTNGYAPLTVTFNAAASRASGTIGTYRWNFGDGTPVQTGATINHTFTTAGTYTTTLTVTTTDGRSDTASQVVFVNQPGLKFYFNFDGNLQANTGARATWQGVQATYTTGKVNQAILPGSSYVQFPYTSDLDGMSQLSLSVWAKKNVASNAGVLVSKSWLYSLALTSQGVTGKVSGEHPVSVATGSGDTNWHHYVLTYDGTNSKLYIDKRLVATSAYTGSIPKDTTTALLIGANLGAVGFNGAIDELKIYNKALSQTEINEVYDTTSDTTPPVVLGASPSGIVAAGTTSTTLSVQTNEAALCKYTTTPGTSYASMTQTLSQLPTTTHSASLTGLRDGVEYVYYVKCADTSLNETATDYVVRFQIASSIGGSGLMMHLDFNGGVSGTIPDLSSRGNSGRCTTSLNQCPSAKVGPDGSGAAGFYGAYPDADNSGDYVAVNKSPDLSNLSNGTITFWTKLDNQNSTISALLDTYQKTGETAGGADVGVPGTWSINTDYQGNHRFIAFDKNSTKQTVLSFPDASAFNNVLQGKPTWNHYAIVWDGTLIKGYYNGVEFARVSQANFPYFTQGLYLTIGAHGHSSLPETGTELFPNHGFANAMLDDIRIYNRGLSQGEIAGIYFSTGGSSLATTPSPSPSTSTSPSVPPANTPDVTRPVISGVAAGSISSTGATIVWATNEGATTQVEYGLTTAYGSKTSLISTYTTTHTQTIANLNSNTTYHYRVASIDQAGNVTLSADQTFSTTNTSTPSAPATPPPSTSSTSAAPAGAGAGAPASPVPPTTSTQAPTGAVAGSPLPSPFTTVSPTTNTPLIKQQSSPGARNEEIRKLQTFLNNQGFTVAVSGPGSKGQETDYFGPATAKALATFQATNNLPQGSLNQATIDRINTLAKVYTSGSSVPAPTTTTKPTTTKYTFTRTLKLGQTGTDVKQLQIFLNNNGYTISTSGAGSKGNESTYFGPATYKALMKFQLANRKTVLDPYGYTIATGFFGPATLKVVNQMWK